MTDFRLYNTSIPLKTTKEIQVMDITDKIHEFVKMTPIYEGSVKIVSAHTTAGLIAQEAEENLMNDMEETYKKLITFYGLMDVLSHHTKDGKTPDINWFIRDYFENGYGGKGKNHFAHDKLELRDCPEDEPINGHAHRIISSHTQHSLDFLIKEGKMDTYDWKRILFVELDGPCPRGNKGGRKVDVQVFGVYLDGDKRAD